MAGWERAGNHFAEPLKGELNAVEKALFDAKACAKGDSFPIRKQKDEIRYRLPDGPPRAASASPIVPIRSDSRTFASNPTKSSNTCMISATTGSMTFV